MRDVQVVASLACTRLTCVWGDEGRTPCALYRENSGAEKDIGHFYQCKVSTSQLSPPVNKPCFQISPLIVSPVRKAKSGVYFCDIWTKRLALLKFYLNTILLHQEYAFQWLTLSVHDNVVFQKINVKRHKKFLDTMTKKLLENKRNCLWRTG